MARSGSRLEEVFSQRLGELRREAGLSQAELAERIEVSTEFVSRMERGKALPAMPTFVGLVRALRCSADELLNPPDDSEEGDARRFIKRLLVASGDVRSRAMFVAESVLEYDAQKQRAAAPGKRTRAPKKA